MKKIVISEKIRFFRKEKRITQEEFSEMIGVSPQAVSKWERYQCYPDITILPQLAKVISCTVDDFFE